MPEEVSKKSGDYLTVRDGVIQTVMSGLSTLNTNWKLVLLYGKQAGSKVPTVGCCDVILLEDLELSREQVEALEGLHHPFGTPGLLPTAQPKRSALEQKIQLSKARVEAGSSTSNDTMPLCMVELVVALRPASLPAKKRRRRPSLSRQGAGVKEEEALPKSEKAFALKSRRQEAEGKELRLDLVESREGLTLTLLPSQASKTWGQGDEDWLERARQGYHRGERNHLRREGGQRVYNT